MKVLVVGSGGREHALVWKIAQSKSVEKIFCAPGNGGISSLARCIDISAEDIPALVAFAKKEKIDLTVVGPEAPLSCGIVDKFFESKLKIFGPTKQAAQLESSKIFAKQLMAKYKIPTAGFEVFSDLRKANTYIERIEQPCVVKADGLAAGKGVVVAQSVEEAKAVAAAMLEAKAFGAAGNKIIIEECLRGQEASIIVLVDSQTIIPLASSQDHKRVFDADSGPNTGGMGAYSPAPIIDEDLFSQIRSTIIEPTVRGLRQEGVIYRGVLYAGVMITDTGPKVLEFNVRLGDPETQAILPRLESDFLEVMLDAAENRLAKTLKTGGLKWDSRACVCVVCASRGYPGEYEKGKEISGLNELREMKNVMAFHSGTKKQGEKYFTSGGRVLGITGLGPTIKEAIDVTYSAVAKVGFEGMHYRTDIAKKALQIFK
ncbi:MAG: phosphoribosylamine--glycine ligase [Candidatus Omnitrophica bacterium]|nr:phosphoribosylamine--glycine ligase [Candidatus Omnitrophota bacterium]